MFRYACLFLILHIGRVQANVTTAPPTNFTTAPPIIVTTSLPTNVTTAAPTNVTTAAPTNVTTAPLTTVPTNVTTALPTNVTTAPPTNVTTAPPTNVTTAPPTNVTTAPPTNVTTVTPTTATTPAPTPLPQPPTGEYSVKAGANGTVCLKARLGLQISWKPDATFETINLEPNMTTVGGECGQNGSDATLVLTSARTADVVVLHFTFSSDGKMFRLHSLNLTVKDSNNSSFSAANTNMSLWEASLGSSYMCNKEQTFNITDKFTLHSANLQVQPYGLKENKFSTAHQCSVDDVSILIPIIVGAALAGLIVIVVIAYVIGRRKTYVGYQTL